MRALDKLPLELMRRALDQFEGMVTNWSPVGLPAPRAKMAVAIIRRESMDPDEAPDRCRTSTLLETGPPRDAAGAVVLARAHEEALAAAYAACAAIRSSPVPTAEVEMQGELGSPSARRCGTGGTFTDGQAAATRNMRPSPASFAQMRRP